MSEQQSQNKRCHADLPLVASGEELMTLAEVTKILPRINGKPHTVSTVWRWCRIGIGGLRLEHLRFGRNMVTSREALSRFFVSLSLVELPEEVRPRVLPKPLPPRSKDRQRSIDEAERILKEAGL